MKKFFSRTVLLQLIMGAILPVEVLAEPTPPAQLLELDYTAPKSYLIEDIQVAGIQTLDKEAIIAFLGLKVGDTVTIPGPTIKEAIQRLWKQRLIKDVDIYASPIKEHSVALTINITESPRLSAYTFEGIKRKEQDKFLEKHPLVKGKVVTEELIKHTKQSIEDYWIEKGYLYATATITTLPDPTKPDHTQLNIKIDKGDKLSINAVHFEGNQHISSDVLRGQLQHIREKPHLTLVKDMLKQVLTLRPISRKGVLWRPPNFKEYIKYLRKHVVFFYSKFNQTKFEEDKKRIISYYQSKGFRDVAIVEDAVCKQDDALLDVRIKVEEGKQYRVGSLKWVGNYRYDDDTLNQILDIKKGDVYNPSLLQQRLSGNPVGEDVATLYADDGHLFFQAEPVEVGLVGDTVALEIRIQEGPQARINKIVIEGNTLTHDHVIRRELRTLPGDKFSRTKVKRSYRELASLGIFDPVIDILPIPSPADNTVDIKYKVKERPKFDLKFSSTFGGEGFLGGLGLVTNNFSLGNLFRGRVPAGSAQTLEVKAESNFDGYKNLALQFTEPWLGSTKPRQLHVSASRAWKDNIGSTGGSVGLGTRLTWPDDYTVLRGSLAYYHHAYEDYNLLGVEEKEKEDESTTSPKKSTSKKENPLKSLDGRLHDLATTISLERNSTDNPLYPKEGSSLSLRVRLTPPWSAFFGESDSSLSWPEKNRRKEYHQWILDSSHFFRLFDNLVLNVRAQFGVLGKFASQKSIGPFERFYLGGHGPAPSSIRGKENISLRGYKDGHITPEDKAGYKGGIIYDKLTLELRYPIVTNYLASIYALAFAEGGNTWAQYKDYDLFDLKRSVGVGLRAYLPILGSLGFDWGYGLNNKANDKSGGNKLEFHFSMGVVPR